MSSSISAKTVRVPKAAELIAAHFREAIIRGQIAAGERLPQEASLIAQFEVSRPTVREAIRILEVEGLITVVRGANGGARVNALNGEAVTRAAGLALQALGATIEEIYAARTLIEPPSARLAAESRPREAAEALWVQYKAEREATTDAERARSIAMFHSVLLAQSGNVALMVVGQALYGVTERHIEVSYRHGPVPGQSAKSIEAGYRSHARLIEIIEAGNGPEAEEHWHRHMTTAGPFWLSKVGKTAVVDVFH
ncbi:GntR family transcriptional regulator [Sphingobium sp. Sx8-8]|uniref:FadR/GntR family transcriptional regulator n=1 Tax=Sphingobium sp. Sx8-8 TaxID=2933617 RepID=UPI001F5996A4|nr:GntR family transcriptional regulator [Sphingobium sp. Sx8-8]